MRTYVIADLHGRFDLMQMALKELHQKSPGTLVFLGDYVDRGPWSRQIIERLMGPARAGWKWVRLKGNHEDIVSQTYHQRSKAPWWLQNGGGATLLSYGGLGETANPLMIPKEHIEFIERLPLYYQDRHRVYVHAGVEPGVPLDEQKVADLLWKVYEPGQTYGLFGKSVVHGHQAYTDGPKYFGDRFAFDTCAYLTGRLVIGVFIDREPGGPVETIEIQGPTLEEANLIAAMERDRARTTQRAIVEEGLL